MKPSAILRSLLSLLLLLSQSCTYSQESDPNEPLLLESITRLVQSNHLAPIPIDDSLSQQIFHAFLQAIDPEKIFFEEAEIAKLRTFEFDLDDQLQAGTTAFFDQAFHTYQKVLDRAHGYCQKWMDRIPNGSVEEYWEADPARRNFATGQANLRECWRLLVKKKYIESLYAIQSDETALSPEQQQQLAKERTRSHFEDQFTALLNQTRAQLFDQYLNSYVKLNDYQSEYLSPEAKARWDANFNREFVGVGLSLSTTHSYPIISEVIIDGPAWKTRAIKPGDRLLAIAAKDNLWIDLAGMPLQEVLDLLGGKPGSQVKLRIKKIGQAIREVVVIRDKIQLDLSVAAVIADGQDSPKLGYIRLPRFYAGEEGCSAHILQQLQALKAAEVDGIIFDVRDNQGGSAREAVAIMGYFLQGGVVMRSTYRDLESHQLDDEDKEAQYQGKLLILVNSKSSSASELFSGTLQDYGRALVVGSQTFGKGTIQRFFDLSDENQQILPGSIKLTMGTFYTAAGHTTQYKGIQPDIILPDPNHDVLTGERAVAHALQVPDLEISESPFPLPVIPSLDNLQALSQARRQANPYFQEIEKLAEQKRAQQHQTRIPLHFDKFKIWKQRSSSSTLTSARSPTGLQVQMLSVITTSENKKKYWSDRIGKDPYVMEASRIMRDYLTVF